MHLHFMLALEGHDALARMAMRTSKTETAFAETCPDSSLDGHDQPVACLNITALSLRFEISGDDRACSRAGAADPRQRG